jgi:hypothetical protein
MLAPSPPRCEEDDGEAYKSLSQLRGQSFALVDGMPMAALMNFSRKSIMHSTVLEIAYRQWPSLSPEAGVSTASESSVNCIGECGLFL